MLSDAPRYVERRETKGDKPEGGSTAKEEAEEIAGFFRSNLSQ